jgi:2-polyprenyl-6-hydroxyphenyl methylase/3-demethylubiquinone-9 3-methyltransferase
MTDATLEIKAGQRFAFGKNWQSFLSTLNDIRIEEAVKSLRDMLGVTSLEGKSFLDIGSGSGLFSLAARRLGAEVCSFDFDPNSVACAQQLKARYFPNDSKWRILQGSALDAGFVRSLGSFDIVYSWGVLHHTGEMWKALENATLPIKPGSRLFIAIYNDQGVLSTFWTGVKKVYCSSVIGKIAMCALFFPYFFARAFAKSMVTGTNQWSEYKRNRGMSLVHDWFDWLGGYPFEVASVEAITAFYQQRGFSLSKVVTTRSWGNNQFVFAKN